MKQVKGTKHSGPESKLKGISSVQLKWMDFIFFKLAGELALKLQLPKNEHASDKHRNEVQGQCSLISLYQLTSYFIPLNKPFICRILACKLEKKKKKKKVVAQNIPVTNQKKIPKQTPLNHPLFSSSIRILQLKKRNEQKLRWIASPSLS